MPRRRIREADRLAGMSESTSPAQGERSELSSVERTLGIVATVLGVAATVWSWPALSTNLAKAFSLAGILLLAVVLARVYKSLKGKKLTWKTVRDWASVGGLCVCATVVSVNLFRPSLPTLRFVQAAGLHECQIYYGTGEIPSGYALLVFDAPPYGAYYLDGTAANQPQGGWRSPLIMTGNDPTYISAVLVPSSSARFIEGIFLTSIQPKVEAKVHSLGLAWDTRTLPPSQEDIPSLTVNSPLDGSGCPR